MTATTNRVVSHEMLRDGVFSTRHGSRTVLMSWPHHLVFPAEDSVTARLRELAAGPVPSGSGDPVTAALRDAGWLHEEFSDGATTLFRVAPLRAVGPQPAASDRLDLSRFTVIRREGDELRLESPLASADVAVVQRELLAAAVSPDSDRGDAATALREQLRRHGLLCEPGGEEDRDFRYRQWSPHELWFHDRSRLAYRGYVGDGFGGTWWGRTEGFAPPPARTEPYDGPATELPVPDLAARRAEDPPYCDVVERRRSRRDHDDDSPIRLEQLAEVLYRTDRVRRVHVEDGVEFVTAPRPSGGSVYELELYPLVSRCDGLDAGFYHYDSHGHRLELVAPVDHPAVRRIVRVASQGSTVGNVPQVVVVVAARVGRVMWKYEGMAYAIILKNTGVLFHALSETATAMGLAGCPLGTDDAAAFTEATGRDPLVEGSVGQFILGSTTAGVGETA